MDFRVQNNREEKEQTQKKWLMQSAERKKSFDEYWSPQN